MPKINQDTLAKRRDCLCILLGLPCTTGNGSSIGYRLTKLREAGLVMPVEVDITPGSPADRPQLTPAGVVLAWRTLAEGSPEPLIAELARNLMQQAQGGIVVAAGMGPARTAGEQAAESSRLDAELVAQQDRL